MTIQGIWDYHFTDFSDFYMSRSDLGSVLGGPRKSEPVS